LKPSPSSSRAREIQVAGLLARIREEAENRPGVYRFVGPRGELLYVGKSVRVRARLLSHLRARDGKPAELVRAARGVEWEYVENEFEAVLREFRSIRSLHPRFNVEHRRRRRFAWIRITAEAAPRIVASRTPRSDGSAHIGPFPATRSLPVGLRELALTVGIRDCPSRTPMAFSDQLELLDLPRTPRCPRAEFGSCPAPCAGRSSRARYLEGVAEARAFLEGRTEAPLERIRARMHRASGELGFEVAAGLRNRESRLRLLRDRVVEARRLLKELSFVYRVPPARAGGAVRIYLIREGRVRLSLDEPEPGDRGSIVRALGGLRSAAREPRIPPERLPGGEREELFLVSRWFRTRPAELARGIPAPSSG
jgi:excinuclease ABC subunit C